MRVPKWSIFLPLVNLVLVLAMSQLGLNQSAADLRLHPEYFYHGNFYYLPPAQIAIYCLNMPAYVASSEFAEFGIRYIRSESRLFTAHSFFFVYYGFFVAVACFWWWIGRQLDGYLRQESVSRKTRAAHYSKVAAYAVATLMSLAMAYDGFLFRRGDLVARPIPISKMVWGIGPCSYFVIMIFRVRTEKSGV